MAKGKAKTQRKGLDSSERRIGKAIIAEWISALADGREMNANALAQTINQEMDLDGPGPHDKLEVGIITDPIHQEILPNGGKVKFIWICVPAPEDVPNWLATSGYVEDAGGGNLVPVEEKADELGEAVLFGCGR